LSLRYLYVDASAIVKLIVPEAETAALENALAHADGLFTSPIGAVEATRAARRMGPARLLSRAEDVLASFVTVDLTAPITKTAADIQPAALRSMDAIHLATAMSLQMGKDDQLEFICYDQRLSDAAEAAGLHCRSPK
jgi:predicted nucleic acid-binding protein